MALLVFMSLLLATFIAAFLGRRQGRGTTQKLTDQKLNRWLIGLSTGTANNSGFVVTGAVGLGYAGGTSWLLLPLAWGLGDVLFWILFPQKINRLGRETSASTATDLMTSNLPIRQGMICKLVIGALIAVCSGGFLAAQWLAGEKFMHGAFGIEPWLALAMFTTIITAYSVIGGFRGSIYVDSLQAVIRLAGTLVALASVMWVAMGHFGTFRSNWEAAGPAFLSAWPAAGARGVLFFFIGFAAAALGAQLSQPQMVTRYLAGASPRETQAAWWIYLGFSQFTWGSMTLFGVLLRGTMPGLKDPEEGLSVFFHQSMSPLLNGVLAADVFATIAATANSLLVVIGQTARNDLQPWRQATMADRDLWVYVVAVGLITMAVTLMIGTGSVFRLAIVSTSLLAAGLGPAMAARLFGWHVRGGGLITCLTAGLAVALFWRLCGLSVMLNEALPGMVAGAVVLLADRGLSARHLSCTAKEMDSDHGG